MNGVEDVANLSKDTNRLAIKAPGITIIKINKNMNQVIRGLFIHKVGSQFLAKGIKSI